MMMYRLARPCLFALDAEKAHDLSIRGLRWLEPWMKNSMHYKPVRLMGLTFPNRIGLAAGLDKQGRAANALFKCGFGFVEVGTITPKPQIGNPKPRLFRLKRDHAIINRMGFNSVGLDAFLQNPHSKRLGILGVNIGKNKSTAIENAVTDYVVALEKVYSIADYVTVNVSSPNTPNLRQLEQEGLEPLLQALAHTKAQCAQRYQKAVPVVVKLSPDLDVEGLKQSAALFAKYGVDGIIATNTTVSRPNLKSSAKDQQGGLSGKPLMALSLKAVEQLYQELGDSIPIIAAGGISSVNDGEAFLQAGAKLIQIYTSFIYQGPAFVRKMAKALD